MHGRNHVPASLEKLGCVSRESERCGVQEYLRVGREIEHGELGRGATSVPICELVEEAAQLGLAGLTQVAAIILATDTWAPYFGTLAPPPLPPFPEDMKATHTAM